ncbi:MAG: trypsin-like peptidase domain-containing protein [Lachnospiraceae bacterium]|nr:trypsin-like peptidase domain-containing protein [Lachnospiraceae bacterium]
MEWEENTILPQDEPGGGKKKKYPVILAGVLLVVALIGLGILAAPYVMPVKQVAEVFTYELGQGVSHEITDYVTGRNWVVAKSHLDLSYVREHEVGEYPVTVHHGFQNFEYIIRIQDTTPPILTLKGGPYVLEVGESYGVDSFAVEARDNSARISWGIAAAESTEDLGSADSYSHTLVFENMGYQRIAISAQDASGNISWLELDVLVDDGPEIAGVRDFYLAVGSQADYMKDITSVDAVDGDVTETLLVDVSQVNTDIPGAYEVVYSNTDQFGFQTKVQALVHVMEPMELQKAINHHVIHRQEVRIIGAFNPYDGGCYTDDDVKLIMSRMEPAMVGLGIPAVSWGSGFVIELGQQEMIICTNQHVVKDRKEIMVYFHDGTAVEGVVKAAEYDLDMAFVTIPVEKLPAHIMDTVMTVHINKAYWESLENETPINLCMRTINEDGSVWRDRIGKLVSKDGQLPEGITYRGVDPITEVDLKLYSGCSGSAILDGYGNLIAMAAGHSDNRYYAIPLGNILDYFEAVFGRKVYYE